MPAQSSVVVQFKDFQPSLPVQRELEALVEEIKKESPKGARIFASFKREKMHAIKGMIRVTSSAGTFFAVASHEFLNSVTHHLLDQLRRRLKKWRSKRIHYSRRRSRNNLTALTLTEK